MRNWKHHTKRGLALFLVLMMCLSLLPTAAFAAESEHAHNEDGWTCVQAEPEKELTCLHEHGEDCYVPGEPKLDCEEEHEHTEDCYVPGEDVLDCAHEHGEDCWTVTEGAWTCTPPAAEEPEEEEAVPAEVQEFLDAAAMLPDASEVTAENAEAAGEEVSAALELYDALDAELCEREDVAGALETVYAVYEAVLAAEEVEDGRTLESDARPVASSAFEFTSGGNNHLTNLYDFFGIEYGNDLYFPEGSFQLNGNDPVVDGGPIYVWPNTYYYGDMFSNTEPVTSIRSVVVDTFDLYGADSSNFVSNGGTTTLKNGVQVTVEWDNGNPANIQFTFDSDRELSGFNVFIRVNFSFGQYNHSGKTYDGWTVFHYGDGTPEAPSANIIEKTPVKINVACKGYETTGHRGYLEYWKDTPNSKNFGLKNNRNGYKVGAVVGNTGDNPEAPAEDFPWQCTVTLVNSYWVTQFNNSYRNTMGTHDIDPSVGAFEITYYSDGQDWYYVTIDSGKDAGLVGNFWVWVTCQKPVTDTTYKVVREYYLNGKKAATVTGKATSGKVGDEIVGQKLAEENPDWTKYTIDKEELDFKYAGCTPNPSLTLGGDATQNVITLRYERSTTPAKEITGFTKELVETAMEAPTGVTGSITYPNDEGTVIFPSADASITLLYKITVTGTAGTNYKVTDEGAKRVAGDPMEGKIPEGGEAVIYVTKSFIAKDINKSGKLVNTAKVEPGTNGGSNATSTETTPAEVAEIPEAPTAKEVNRLVRDSNGEATVEVTCKPERHGVGKFDCYNYDEDGNVIHTDRITIGKVQGNANDGYTCKVTFLAEKYEEAYSNLKGKEHTLVEGEANKIITFQWNGSAWELVPGQTTPVTFQVECQETERIFKLVYDLNGGAPKQGEENAFAAQVSGTKTETVKTFTLVQNLPEKTDATFLGWADSKTANQPQYRHGGQITLSTQDPNVVRTVENDGTVVYTKTIHAVWFQNTDMDTIKVTKTIQKIATVEGQEVPIAIKSPLRDGDVVYYTVTAENKTGLPLTDLEIFDDMDLKLADENGMPSVTDVRIQTEGFQAKYYTYAAEGELKPLLYMTLEGTLLPNATVSVTYRATVQGADGSKVENYANVYANVALDLTARTSVFGIGGGAGATAPSEGTPVNPGTDKPTRPGGPGGTLGGGAGTQNETEQNKPALTVEKTAKVNGADATTAKVGDTITYTVTVKNTGNVDLTNVTVEDSMDDKVKLTNGDFGPFDLGLDETKTITYTYTVQEADEGKNVTNTVRVTSDKVTTPVEATVTVNVPAPEITGFAKVALYEGLPFLEDAKEVLGADYVEKYSLTIPRDVPKDGCAEIDISAFDSNGKVTLLFLLSITGEPGAAYEISDPDTTYVGGDPMKGKLPPLDPDQNQSSVWIYVTKTYTKDDMVWDEDWASYWLTNSATVTPGVTPPGESAQATTEAFDSVRVRVPEKATITYPGFEEGKLPEDKTEEVEAGVKIIVDPNGGTWTPATPDDWTKDGGTFHRTAQEGERITLAPNPTQDGHVFLGWKKDVSQDGKTITYTAQWEKETPDQVIVTAGSVVVTYDGQDHPVTNVTVTKNGQTVTPDNSITITYTQTGTNAPVNAGTYTATITAQVDGQTVTGTATVTILQRTLTVRTGSSSKRYDGYALTNSSITITGQAPGESITGRTTGSQTRVGNSPNSYTLTWGAGVLSSNYRVVANLGTLEVTSGSTGGGSTGGGGGGGGRPGTNPTNPGAGNTTIGDVDVPLAGDLQLNKTDHFAYIKGYQDGTVRPNNPITRAQVATIFYRLLDETSRVIYFQETNDFTDVTDSYWANKAISTLSNAGIITGFNDGTFRPNAYITRAQFAAIAARFDNVVPGLNNPFTDVAEDYWARDLIAFAADRGWITGNGGKFRPLENITRVEVMDFINNVLERHVDKDGLLENAATWSDVPVSDPNYYVVEEATNSHDYTRRTEGQLMENWTKLNEDPVWDE